MKLLFSALHSFQLLLAKGLSKRKVEINTVLIQINIKHVTDGDSGMSSDNLAPVRLHLSLLLREMIIDNGKKWRITLHFVLRPDDGKHRDETQRGDCVLLSRCLVRESIHLKVRTLPR